MRELVTHPFDYVDPIKIFAQIQQSPYSLFFDSSHEEHPLSRYSFIACDPLEKIELRHSVITIRNAAEEKTSHADPFQVMKDRMELWARGEQPENKPHLPPFQGGLAGLFAYDLGRTIEKLPNLCEYDPEMPDLAVGIYDHTIAFDNNEKKAWLLVRGHTAEEARTRRAELLEKYAPLFASAHNINFTPTHQETHLDWTVEVDKQEYSRRIDKVIDYINAGDIFQANLSQRFTAKMTNSFDPFRHYTHLRQVNGAPFGGFMRFDDLVISSSSPERFLFVQDKEIDARPIKGTRRRDDNPMTDLAIKEELKHAEKDRAENSMIVDLMRNDLSKVCEDHNMKVEKLCGVETFTTVHHLVSTIKARLRANLTPLDLLRACFPGGSITGCPKIRAMEIIEELEDNSRASYCGSIGYIGFDGTMDTNIMIRVIQYWKNKAIIQTGGGIVTYSNAESEYQETLDKAAALLSSFDLKAEDKERSA